MWSSKLINHLQNILISQIIWPLKTISSNTLYHHQLLWLIGMLYNTSIACFSKFEFTNSYDWLKSLLYPVLCYYKRCMLGLCTSYNLYVKCLPLHGWFPVNYSLQHMLKQYALSQEPARKEFLDNLFAFLSKEGTISCCMCISISDMCA